MGPRVMGAANDMVTYDGVADDDVDDNGVDSNGVTDNVVYDDVVILLSLPTTTASWKIGPLVGGQ